MERERQREREERGDSVKSCHCVQWHIAHRDDRDVQTVTTYWILQNINCYKVLSVTK